MAVLAHEAGRLQVTADDVVAGSSHHAARSITPLFTASGSLPNTR
jgi:hypothetical protein